MKNIVFEHTDYKDFLRENLQPGGKTLRGQRLKLAEYIGCQPSYLSQVLGGKPHLTLEQGLSFCRFLLLGPAETDYFVLLLEYARAGSAELQKHFLEKIKKLQAEQFDLKKRLVSTDSISESDRHRYYSAWYYSAIHVMLSVESLQAPATLSTRLNLPEDLVVEVIRFLEGIGLIENRNGIYKLTKNRIHLGRESMFIQQHHINWRSQCLQSVEKNLKDDLHYSNVIAIAKSDFVRIKEVLVKSIEDARSIIGPSREEDVYTLALDFFKL